ncbi:MAG: TIM barrel protein [Methylacidiphilales bacterium]|nr:TIM barrel protein [Candidatus Methylacidiphilales bacterium]
MGTLDLLKPGLVSITFRKLTPPQIVALCSRAGVSGIEWGGDVHAPHGDLEVAKRVSKLTRDAGLEVAAYGSYYRVGSSEQDGLPFEKVLDSAVALAAPRIRVWGGVKGSAQADEAYFNWVSDESSRIAALAQEAGVRISYEYHEGTLLDTIPSALKLMEKAGHPNLEFLWQPPHRVELSHCLRSLESVLPRLSNVHVFHWWPDPGTRLPLADGAGPWRQYLDILLANGKPRYCLLEFVKDDEPAQFLEDAATLKRWISEASVK